MALNLNQVFLPSEDIVARVIEGELIIVPLAAGIGDLEDELYTLNDTGRSVWELLDGQNNLGNVISAMEVEYDAPKDQISRDVFGLVEELVKRKILVEVPSV